MNEILQKKMIIFKIQKEIHDIFRTFELNLKRGEYMNPKKN